MRTQLSLLVLVLLLPAAFAAGQTSGETTLAVSAPTTLTGLPVEIEVTLSEGGARPATVFLNGQEIGTHNLAAGANALSFEDLELEAGSHDVVVTSGSLSAEISLRLIPGWLSVLPPLLAIGLALATRDVLISLFLGIFGGAFILFNWNPFVAFGRSIDTFIAPAVANPGQAAILVFTILLGGMVGLITKNGGTHGIVERLKPYATSPRRGQLATWALGVMVFFDDYANTLIVGPTMRPITDKLKISREKLAYIVDSPRRRVARPTHLADRPCPPPRRPGVAGHSRWHVFVDAGCPRKNRRRPLLRGPTRLDAERSGGPRPARRRLTLGCAAPSGRARRRLPVSRWNRCRRRDRTAARATQLPYAGRRAPLHRFPVLRDPVTRSQARLARR